MNERYKALKAELDFRKKAIFRVYPDAKIRYGCGGFAWDASQPAVVMVVLHDSDSHGVFYDEELTLLKRAIDREMEIPEPNLSDDHPAARTRNTVLMLFGCACLDDLWESEEVQAFHARLMSNSES